MQKINIKAEVKKIIYESLDSGFKVAFIDLDNEEQKITGIMPDLKEGFSYDFEIIEDFNDNYGFQFNVVSYKIFEPVREDDIINFLASGAFKGIGPVNAKAIVDKFKDKSLDILKTDIDRLLEVKGIGKKGLEKIKASVEEHFEASDSLYELSKMGFSLAQSNKIYSKYKEESLEIVRDNPYRLLAEIKGIGFKIIDKIALENGFDQFSSKRIDAIIMYEMQNFTYLDGNLCVSEFNLFQRLKEKIIIEEDVFVDAIERLIDFYRLIKISKDNQHYLYLSEAFEWESNIVDNLLRLSLAYKPFGSFENIKSSIDLSKEQNNALFHAFDEGIFILTGAAGTGKTTILKELIHRANSLGLRTLQAAPTGRAASRMEEVIGLEASTIHRMLQYQYDEDDSVLYFLRDEENPLDAEIIFIDEASMVDARLFSSLLSAIPSGSLLVLIGDANQLPPVGAGMPFIDMIESKVFNTKQLSKIHRQAKNSEILNNAHIILNGGNFEYNKKDSDFYYFSERGNQNTLDRVLELVSQRIPRVFNYEPLESITVLSPIKRGILGVENLNKELQRVLNPLSNNLYFEKFAAGDKVMQIKNNYNVEWINKETGEEGAGVFNGDIGFITSASTSGINVKFLDGKEIFYKPNILRKELDLAYAMTVHKSQGNEFDVVVLPAFFVPPVMQNKKLMYTAVTRAKKLFVIAGDVYNFELAANSNDYRKTESFLKDRLIALKEE